MPKYIDEQGNEIETITPDEAKNLQEKVKELEDKTKSYEKELDDTKVALSKFKSKDYNFRRFEDYTEEQRKALSQKEIEMMKFQEMTEEEIRKANEQTSKIHSLLVESWKKSAIKDIGSSIKDEDKKQFDEYYNQLMSGKEETEETIQKAMKDAYVIIKNKNSTSTNLSGEAVYTGSGTYNPEKPKNPNDPYEGLSEGAKELAEKLNW